MRATGANGGDGIGAVADASRGRRPGARRLGVCIVALALLLPAASAFAQAVNKSVNITDSTEPDTTAVVNHTNAINSGTGQTICRNPDVPANTVTFSMATTHPDFVRLARARSRMEQRQAGNLPTVRVIGAGARVFNVVQTCIVATWRSDVDYRVNANTGSFRVDAQTCTGLTQVQIDYFRDTCAADVANETIQLETEGLTIQRVRLRGSGNAL